MTENKYKELIQKLTLRLIFCNPILGKFVTLLSPVITVSDEKNNSLAWTDFKNIYINLKQIDNWLVKDDKKIPQRQIEDELTFVIAHEILHILGFNFERGNGKNHKIMNMATDYVNNLMLVNNGFSKPKDCLCDRKYAYMTCEEVYKLLKKDVEDIIKSNWSKIKKDIDKNKQNGENEQGENGQSGDKEYFDITDLDLPNEIKESAKQITKEIIEKEIGKSFDSHDKLDTKKMTEEQKQFIRQTQIAAKEMLKQENSSAFLNELLKLIPTEYISWKNILKKNLSSLFKANSTWKLPHKKSISVGAYLPSLKKDTFVKVMIAIDTSGSISEKELNEFYSQIISICKQQKNYQIGVVCFSDSLHSNTYKIFTNKNIKELANYKTTSTGGTDINSAFQWFEKINKKEKYETFICMTDGYDNISMIKQPRKTQTIWLIKNNNGFTSPFTQAKVINF